MFSGGLGNGRHGFEVALSRNMVIGLVLVAALIAFEIFNFDTTQYALANLLGEVNFLGLRWAAILAFAFCAIDFAGLAHLFTPEKGMDEPREVWYLMGAWLLGATMNAIMTWWAVSLTLLNHNFGNEILSRGQLLQIVPIFVAVLVWLTRILFIGALSVAGDTIFNDMRRDESTAASARKSAVLGRQPRPSAQPVRSDAPIKPVRQQPATTTRSSPSRNRRVRRRPPVPGSTVPRPTPAGMHARSRQG